MRFMIIRRADADTEAGIFPENTAQLFEDMIHYNQRMADAGVLKGGDGLQPTSRGALVQFRNGKPSITDGPFTEAKEIIAGFTLIEVGSREEALEWVRQWPTSDGNGNVTLELRQLYDAEDFGDKLPPELREQEERQRAQIAQA
jgi:hypothetical protein